MSEIISNNITWNAIDWNKTQKSVRKIQYRIYQASMCGNIKRKHWLQKFLINSIAAKLIATRQVTTFNKGKRTAGVDGLKITTPQEKLKLALKLELDGKSKPIRRVWVPKPEKVEKRPLGIPILEDRAKQALAKLALEPEWEAIFEPDSYGFRPGRSALDAIEAIFLNLHFETPKWVFDADIRKRFDMINHNALLEKLNTFPIMKRQIKAWLNSGVMEGYANSYGEKEILSTEAGTPQGGVISPLLANIALHGLQNHLKDFVGNLPMKPHLRSNRGRATKMKALGVIRYADDFVLIHRNREILELCIEETRKWLKNIGLEISEENTALRDGREGFQFLGFQIIQISKCKKYKVKIHPSKKSQLKLLLKVREIIQKNKAISSFDLIQMLRPVILGWANYFKYSECTEDFHKLTDRIFRMIRAWVFRRDTRNGRKVIREKYFPTKKTYQFDGNKHLDNWILTGTKKLKGGMKVENYLPHLVWVKSRKHVKIKGNESPYNKSIYWSIRSNK